MVGDRHGLAFTLATAAAVVVGLALDAPHIRAGARAAQERVDRVEHRLAAALAVAAASA